MARGVILLHKRKHLERPIQSVCPLEIPSVESEPVQDPNEQGAEPIRERRRAAVNAETRIREMFREND